MHRVNSLEFEDPVIGAATWRRALLNAGAPIHKALRLDLTYPPAITKQQQQQDVLVQFFAAGDTAFSHDSKGPHPPQGMKRETLEGGGPQRRHHQKAATWVWLLVGTGGTLVIAVAAVTAVLAYQVLQQKRAAREDQEAAAAAAAEARISTAAKNKPPRGPPQEGLQGPHHNPVHPPRGPR